MFENFKIKNINIIIFLIMKANRPKPSYYEQQTHRKFGQIFHKNQDIMQNSLSSIPQPNPHRQQILTSQYPMEKKGKNFNKVQQRIFRIDQGLLKQIDKNDQAKDLPFPKSIIKQELSAKNKNEWGFVDYRYRLAMQFQERSEILVYTKTKQQITQIFSFICSKIHSQQRDIMHASFEAYYKQKLMRRIIKDGNRLKESLTRKREQKKQRLLNKIRQVYTQKIICKQFILSWHKKAAMKTESNEKISQKLPTTTISLKNVISELAFNLQYIRIFAHPNSTSGELKLWVNQITNNQVFKFSQLLTTQHSNSNDNSFNPFLSTKRFNLSGHSFAFKNQTPALTLSTSFQFQVETITDTEQKFIWRSQRFYAIDLLKSLKSGPKKSILLWHKQKFMQLILTFVSAKNQVIHIQIPPVHEKFPSSYTYNLKPNHYPILNEIISKQLLKKYIQSLTPQTVHLQYTFAFQEYLQTQSTRSLNFTSFSKLYEMLNIDNIIEKFFSTHPYDTFTNVQFRATFIYEYLAKKSEKFAYYDAQKFIWKYQCPNLRRFLSVIKAFDQRPRINFSQPFYYFCLNCLKIAQKQSAIKWKSQIFENTLMGRQSLAFFLVLGILRCSSQLQLYQMNKAILSNNSLLFHYILKKRNKRLYNKFLQIQINIEALFGVQSASLFSQLFVQQNNKNIYVESSQLYILILHFFIKERKQQQIFQMQNPQDTSRSTRLNHHFSLVSAFLAILHLFDHIISTKTTSKSPSKAADEVVGNSAAYASAYNFIQYLKIFVISHLQIYTLQFSFLYNQYYSMCEQELGHQNSKSEYITLQQNLQKFYNQNQSTEASFNRPETQNSNINNLRIGQLLSKLFSEFMCYRHKNQGDIRKICLVIDNINLGVYFINNGNMGSSTNYRPSSLLIQVLQSNSILYQHEYVVNSKGQKMHTASKEGKMDEIPSLNLYYQNLKHTIEIKLNRLSKIHILISYIDNSSLSNSNMISYCAVLDPKQIPSNYYIQLIKQLSAVTVTNGGGKLSVENKIADIDSNRYICLQTYIKDSCDVDYLENAVPNQYINLLLLKDRISSDKQKDNQFSQQNQLYKKDVIFCNHYFRSYRLTENNFNLLYAKLGWYGNHYLLPADRINHVLTASDNQFNRNNLNNRTNKKQGNNPQIISTILMNNQSQISVRQLSQMHSQRIFQILFYTRCIYGRGLVPSIAYPSAQKTVAVPPTQIILQQCRNNKILMRQCKQLKHEINQNQFNSCNNLMGYLFDNFNTVSISSQVNTYNLVDFYIRAVKELPLIRYLCFRPLQFYFLDQIQFSLKVYNAAQYSPSDVDIKNYSSNPVKSNSSSNMISSSPSTSIKNKLLTFSPLQSHKSEETPSTDKTYEIVLTNFPILANKNSNMIYHQDKPYKFISNPSYFTQQLYKNYSQDTQLTYVYSTSTRLLFSKLMQGTELPPVMYFTYPQAINYKWTCDGTELYQSSSEIEYQQASRQMHVDQFLWLLKMNIIKYYIIDYYHGTVNLKNQKDKQKDKNNKYANQIPDCQIKMSDTTFPNLSIWDLFQFISEIKHKIQLAAFPIVPFNTVSTESSTKNIQLRYPVILNPAFRHYTSYGQISGLWSPICILARIMSPNLQLYYCEEKYTRKLRLLRSSEVILGIENKRMLQKLPFFKFTDNEILSGRQCFHKELIRIY